MDPKHQQNSDPERDQEREGRPPLPKYYGLLLILLIVGVLMLPSVVRQKNEEVKFNEFLSLLEKNKVGAVELYSFRDTLEFSKKSTPDKLYTVSVSKEEFPNLSKELRKRGVPFTYGQPGTPEAVGPILYILVPFLIVLGLMVIMMRQAGAGATGQVFNFGKSRARRLAETTKITFKDVAGVDEAKEELAEVVDFLKDPGKFNEIGAKIPKGILLVGPPGSGKTLLAKAIAGEAGVPFFYMSGSDFVEMFVGVGASRVRDLFSQAKKNAPCLIFIDEIDAVGRQRGAGLGGGHDEREQTLNQMLVEMDGFEPNSGVILLAATNRPDVLDPALLRPGRFDRQIVVDNPDARGREEILRIHAKDKPLGADVDLTKIAKATIGFSGADLANVCNEAAILAVRRGRKTITMDDMNEAIERSFAGPQRKSRTMRREERYMTAIHEAGHALAARFTPEANNVHKITILPRGRALGYTLLLPNDDLFSKTRKELLADIVVSLGGMVAEDVVFGDITTGAAGGDLKQVTAVARAMVMEYGMSDELGPIAYGTKHGVIFLGRDLNEERNYSEAVAEKIDQEVFKLVETCRKQCEEILTTNKAVLLAMADLLMEEETISGDDMDRLILEINEEPPPPKRIRTEVSSVLRTALHHRAAGGNGHNGNSNGGSHKPPLSLEGTEGALLDLNDVLTLPEPPETQASGAEAKDQPAAVAPAEQAPAIAPAPAPPPATPAPVPSASALSKPPEDNEGRMKDFFNGIGEIKSRIKEKLLSQDADALRVLKHIHQVVDSGDMEAAIYELQETQQTAKGDLGIYVHMEMGEVYLKQERVAEAVKEYMRVLMLGAVKLGQQSERIIISYVRYLKILDQLMTRNGLTLKELTLHPDLIREANSMYEEWEHRVGYPKS